jgi:hypothetical protein
MGQEPQRGIKLEVKQKGPSILHNYFAVCPVLGPLLLKKPNVGTTNICFSRPSPDPTAYKPLPPTISVASHSEQKRRGPFRESSHHLQTHQQVYERIQLHQTFANSGNQSISARRPRSYSSEYQKLVVWGATMWTEGGAPTMPALRSDRINRIAVQCIFLNSSHSHSTVKRLRSEFGTYMLNKL